MPETIDFRLATDDDQHLEAFDNTKLTAYSTCPTWGVIRYQRHLRMPNAGRAMALEAGSAMHEVFSYVRLMQLWRQLVDSGLSTEHVQSMLQHHGVRLYGEQRWDDINVSVPLNEAFIDRVKAGCLNVLETGEFYDDDRDKRRTMTNLEEAALHYVDRWNWSHPIWVRDINDPTSDVGIEIPYDIVASLGVIPMFRFTGRLDGIRLHGDKLTVEDNKTSSRISEALELSFETSSQLTGYMVAASVFTDQAVRNAEAIALAIPIPGPKSVASSYSRTPTSRTPQQVRRWIAWMLWTVNQYKQADGDPTTTLQFTHSCNRYFRPCSMIPFCVSDKEDQEQILKEMVFDPWSPLEKQAYAEGE